MSFFFHIYRKSFPHMWKNFTTDMVKFYDNYRKTFRQLLKKRLLFYSQENMYLYLTNEIRKTTWQKRNPLSLSRMMTE